MFMKSSTRRSASWKLRNLLFGAFLMAGMTRLASAQVTGSISGKVQDLSGASVPSATVTVNNTETGISRMVTTDVAGN